MRGTVESRRKRAFLMNKISIEGLVMTLMTCYGVKIHFIVPNQRACCKMIDKIKNYCSYPGTIATTCNDEIILKNGSQITFSTLETNKLCGRRANLVVCLEEPCEDTVGWILLPMIAAMGGPDAPLYPSGIYLLDESRD